MNCRKFETIINELAREQLMDAAMRESGLAHAAECVQCGARMADEQALTAGLRAMKSGLNAVEAPARVEAALLAAFRERAAVAPVASVIPLRRSARRWLYWSSGVAAAAVILLTVTLNIFRLPQPASSSPVVRNAGSTVALSTGQELAATSVATNKSLSNSPASYGSGPITANSQSKSAHNSASQYASYQRRATVRPFSRRGDLDERARDAAAVNNNANQQEVATEFLPLTYDTSVASLDSGQIVRVELPRSALVSMGLPMNIERAGERVKADVLLGDDGVARAIRFVR